MLWRRTDSRGQEGVIVKNQVNNQAAEAMVKQLRTDSDSQCQLVRYHGRSLAGAYGNAGNNRRQKQKAAYIRKEVGTEYRNLHDAVWLNEWMIKSGEVYPRYYASGLLRWSASSHQRISQGSSVLLPHKHKIIF
jgi:hypothetical protein